MPIVRFCQVSHALVVFVMLEMRLVGLCRMHIGIGRWRVACYLETGFSSRIGTSQKVSAAMPFLPKTRSFSFQFSSLR